MTRHIKTIHSILVLALAGITTAAQSPLTGFAGKTDPVTVGNIIAEAFVRADAEQKDHIYYSTSSLWTNCLEFAHNTSNSDLEKALTDKMIPYYKEKSNFLPHRYHVDYTIFGAVPLEIYILSRDKKALRLGLSYADNQWAMPDTTDSETMKLNPKVSPAQQMEYWKLGYSPQTRLWIDDMYMISLLQLQAYKATGEKKYLDRAAYEMAFYTKTIQQENGLFHHTGKAPFFWGRGNGWMAAAMPMILRVLPEDGPNYGVILESYRKMAATLLRYQRESGLWGQLIDDAESWDESSASAMFVYSFIEGFKAGILGTEYAMAARKGWIALCDKLNAEGKLEDVCIGTGGGPDRQYYLDRKRVAGDRHGQAAMMWVARILTERPSDGKPEAGMLNNAKIDGFRPIWYDHTQSSEYGSKYSGAFGTYTMKHRPLAIYDEASDRTYFVYGGTTNEKEKHLLAMVSCYDHKTGLVQKPTVVYDKGTVLDPHDNPALLIDDKGYIWVFVAGRMNFRPGFKFRSVKPHDISEFELMCDPDVMAYPQPYFVEGEGYFLFYTRYDGKRQIFYRTSRDGIEWSDYKCIANIRKEGDTMSGQYQITGKWGNRLVSAFNRHLNGNVDTRTNIYYIQTDDFGKTWTRADGTEVKLPVTDKDDPCKIIDYEHTGQNCYIKDVNFDKDGNPIILYLTSYGHQPGPKHGPREWHVANWDGKKWNFHDITTSTNNYDSGSLYVNGKEWTAIAPFEAGPTYWGQGGEIVAYTSRNNGKTWRKTIQYTENSPMNHCYVRRPENARDPFIAYWADGNPDAYWPSRLYFADSEGNVYRLPYDMKEEWAAPELISYIKNK